MLRLWVCGRFAAELDGEPLAVPGGDRVRALVGWLALHPGTHPRTALAARLWPDVPEASARASLRTAVWSVRQGWGEAGERVLDGSRTAFGLRPELVRVDALDDPADADGELLPGVPDAWADAEREEHRRRRVAALERLAAAAEEAGDLTEAVRRSRRWCELAPLDEGAHRDLLRRLAAAGDRAGAVVASREFSERLRAEIGVRPSPVTRAVQARVGAPAPARPPARLFGRAAEVAELRRLWRTAADGAGQVVVLTGEAGIGKTTLVADLAERAATAGGRTAVGAGGDVGGETPFGLWLELARALVATVTPVPADAVWPVELSRLSPELGVRLGRTAAPPAVAAPEIERLRVFESVLRLVEWSCADRPALVALDDAHLADRASLRLTAHIGRRLGRLPLLLVLIRRDRPVRAELDALLADVAARGVPVTELAVGPIDERDISALAAAAGLRGDSVRRVVAAAEGNPLLAVESARALAAGVASPPPNLRTAVRATMGRLPAEARSLAGLLAAAGRPLSAREVEALGVAGGAGTAAAADAAIESGLLVRRDGRLGFRHDLIRESVLADVADRGPLHDRLAAAVDGDDRAGVARHLALAGRPAEAARQWAAAAAYARSVGATAEAAEFLERAVECAPEDGDTWLDLQEARAWLGRAAETDQAWERALALLPADALPAAWARRGRQLRSVVCHPESSFAAYRHAERLLTADSPARLRADVLIGLAWGDATAGDPALVDGLLAAAAEHLPPEPDAQVATDVAEIRILGLIRQGRFAECGAVAAATDLGGARLPDRAYAVWINAACGLTCAGDLEGALALADRAVAATRAVPVLHVECLAARAHLLARLGRAPEAVDAVRRQRELAARLDVPAMVGTAAHDAGLVALELGRWADAAAWLGEALAGGAPVSRPAAAIARAEALARAGDADAAEAQLRAAALEPVTRADQPWSLVPRMAAVQALVADARGDPGLARERWDEAAGGWRRMLATAARETADGYFATLVDLGRPPVVGLVDPARELARIERDRAPA
jgi:DNA-binding SARP family transcriptional activator/tetratricopeptide (TPR) repeat protein